MTTTNTGREDEQTKNLDKFHYALLTATLFMSQVPCDSSYDKQMAKLLGEVKKAHDEQVVLLSAGVAQTHPNSDSSKELEEILTSLTFDTWDILPSKHSKCVKQALSAIETYCDRKVLLGRIDELKRLHRLELVSGDELLKRDYDNVADVLIDERIKELESRNDQTST